MMTFRNFKIAVADRSTRDICSIYLVGGFDEDKNHHSERQEFRGGGKKAYMDMRMRRAWRYTDSKTEKRKQIR